MLHAPVQHATRALDKFLVLAQVKPANLLEHPGAAALPSLFQCDPASRGLQFPGGILTQAAKAQLVATQALAASAISSSVKFNMCRAAGIASGFAPRWRNTSTGNPRSRWSALSQSP